MNISYKEGNPIYDHINNFQGVLDQLSKIGVKFDEEIQVLWLLNILPDSFETLQVSLTNSALGGIVTMTRGEASLEVTMSRSKSKSKYKNIKYDYYHKNGHVKKYCYRYKRAMRQYKKDGDNENHVSIIAKDDLLVTCGENAINLVCG
ncbi:uncharacterized protein LOC129899979 [Solanum dulcamara]|uniref:uncharacterized protein LOC129899979 n=1 Tax=Solanum dulcamara TaxID=45834 RepID=UPI0024858675|nr:uncharacterized protein LOC129899979 [Solanum dulcamara]